MLKHFVNTPEDTETYCGITVAVAVARGDTFTRSPDAPIDCPACLTTGLRRDDYAEMVATLVEEFAEAMQDKMLSNRHKGIAGPEDFDRLLKVKLPEELAEFHEAIAAGDADSILEEAADVANVMMMLANIKTPESARARSMDSAA